MRAVVERVSRAAVWADGAFRGEIGQGLFILLGVGPEDTEETALRLADKIVALRIFSDPGGKMNLSLSQVGGAVAVVSNFTLYANTSHGRRPDFFGAAAPARASVLYDAFAARVASLVATTVTGVFGADMQIDTCCDGPVTLVLDTDEEKRRFP